MTREEIKKAMHDTKREVVLKNLHKLLSLVEGYPEYEDCISYAIEELEQEPILDKLRAEIKELPTYYHEIRRPNSVVLRDMVVFDEVLKILDKYKAETEKT